MITGCVGRDPQFFTQDHFAALELLQRLAAAPLQGINGDELAICRLVAAILLLINSALALFGIAAVTVLLLFIGIHNAWDTVTYVAIEYSQPENKSQDQ